MLFCFIVKILVYLMQWLQYRSRSHLMSSKEKGWYWSMFLSDRSGAVLISMMAEGRDVDWELSKENIQPLRRGRDISALHQALTQLQDGDSSAINQQRQYGWWWLDTHCVFKAVFNWLLCSSGPLRLNCECMMEMIHLMFGIGKETIQWNPDI